MHITPRILVTGAGGQLGQELQALAPLYPKFAFYFAGRAELPVEDAEKVESLFTQLQPQYCFNCAAYTAVDKAESEPELAMLINGVAVGALAAACKRHNTRLLHISTDYVFNGSGTAPYLETDATGPVSVYGASKLLGEQLALAGNPETIIIRTSWVYSQYGKNFVKTMRQLLQQRSELNVVNDQMGSPTWAAGLARNLLQMVNMTEAGHTAVTGIFHYCDAGIISWYDFAVAIKEITGSKCIIHPIPASGYPTPARRPAWSALDTSKIQELPGIQILSWKENLQACLRQLDAGFNREHSTGY